MGRKLKKHKLARISMVILGILYFCALFGNFIAPYGLDEFDGLYRNASPTKIHFMHNGEFVGPHVYKLEKNIDKKTFTVTYTDDLSEYYPVQFFVHGTEYKFLGLFDMDLHLFGVGTGSNGGTGAKIMLFGADSLGRDLFFQGAVRQSGFADHPLCQCDHQLLPGDFDWFPIRLFRRHV